MGPPDPFGSVSCKLPDALPPLSPSQDLAAAVRPLKPASWAEVLLAMQIETPEGRWFC